MFHKKSNLESETGANFCKNCGEKTKEKDEFCKNCGTKIDKIDSLTKACPFCKEQVGSDERECPNCRRILFENIGTKQKKHSLEGVIGDQGQESLFLKTKDTLFNCFNFIKKSNYFKIIFNRYALIIFGIILIILAFSEEIYITDPKEVFNYTYGEFNIEAYSPISFEEYYNLEDFRDEALSYEDFEESTFLDSCERKNTMINFEDPVYSEFRFNYGEKSFVYETGLYNDLYYFSKNLKSQDCYFDDDNPDKRYFSDPYNNYFIDKVSENFLSLSEMGYSNDEIVEIATIFVQSIPYGNTGAEPNQYPYETFYIKEGNCLDKSVILAGILDNMGYTPYIISVKEEIPHALVGIVCDDGNMTYENKNICFVETTMHVPIGFDGTATNFEKYLKVADGHLIYSEANYGKGLAEYIKNQELEIENIVSQIDFINLELTELRRKMCGTDCESCRLGADKEYVTLSYEDPCYDAYQYNQYATNYNLKIEKLDSLYEKIYKIYYNLDEVVFWNNFDIDRYK